jgi:peptidoglycan L-alanyl-D-glutamate endopeptidase CwlK
MSLRKKQSIFALNLSKLISYAFSIGYEITMGEVLRTNDQQLLYFEGYTLIKEDGVVKLVKTKPKSKTMNGYHPKKLAADINVFVNGAYKTDKETYKPLAEYWKSLNEKNISGYDWGWDLNHFQMSN